MFDERSRFVMENYQKKPPFSSFLPGIAGPLGVPVWCYYNNRGQAVCSFGAQDKDHAIMEFQSAHTAYQAVKYTGFRTFCKIDGVCHELLTENCRMHIGMSELEITGNTGDLAVSALYFGVPGQRTAALARVLTARNTGSEPVRLELLDGMPALVPYGISQDHLKNMSNLAKAWMQVEDAEHGQAYFRVRASLADTASVTTVEEGNFCLAWDGRGQRLKPIVQPSLIFGEDTSLTVAEAFAATPLEGLCARTQVTQNLFPCCFLPVMAVLAPGESAAVYSLYGQAENKRQVAALSQCAAAPGWFAKKRQEAADLTDELCAPITAQTADPIFDAYAKQSWLDNFLRGGVPTFFRDGEKQTPYYLYSRKHGDPEREYNYFSLGKEYYAQGNGNFRDVNQNRRSDVLFAPEVGAENIHTFFELIQADGYNPLVITPSVYTLDDRAREQFAQALPGKSTLLSGAFTPGQIAMAAEDAGMTPEEVTVFTAKVICAAYSEPSAEFSEGYWCDHWTYNLDLIESYLAVYPEKKEELLFGGFQYRWYESKAMVNPRAKRYCVTENGLRQYYALGAHRERNGQKWMRTADGNLARSTLAEKLIALCVLKTATLDAAGMGVEMEGGKPGWYDALNGLPGLLGSSMAESCELARLLAFTADALEQEPGTLSLYTEIAGLLTESVRILTETADNYTRWDLMNTMKEHYRASVWDGFVGSKTSVSRAEVAAALRQMEQAVLQGIEKAKRLGTEILPTYFTFRAERLRQTADGVMPLELTPAPLPLFLEGPVRYLKLALPMAEKQRLADALRHSDLYDEKLRMYRVNASLAGASFEVGRAKAFTPGWLENGSIWLHMEYKYLLELLKSGMYREFSQAFRDAAVPFQNPERYGRSPLENVSFIASSVNPDPAVHGRGFVARLPGSTAEFVQIWQLMFFGRDPFRMKDGKLTLGFRPFVPAYLMPDSGCVSATFLGQIPVVYEAAGLRELVPGKTSPISYTLTWKDGTTRTLQGDRLEESCALAVRNGEIAKIYVTMR